MGSDVSGDGEAADIDVDDANHSIRVRVRGDHGGAGGLRNKVRDLRGDIRDVWLCTREPVPTEVVLAGDRENVFRGGGGMTGSDPDKRAPGARALIHSDVYRIHVPALFDACRIRAPALSGVCNILVLPQIVRADLQGGTGWKTGR